MIRKEKGEFVAECEECGTDHYGGVIEDFRAFIDDLKANGWSVRNDGGEWVHYCEDCKD